MYKIGREVEVADRSAEHAIVSLIGPASAPLTGIGPARRRGRAPRGRGRRRHLPGRRHRRRHRPARARRATPRRWHAALEDAGVAAVSEAAAEIVRVESGRPRFGREMGNRDDPPGGGDQRPRRELYQGLLHRPGDRRPPALQGQAQPPPARACARTARRRRRPDRRRRARGRHRRHLRPLPRPRADRAGDPAARGRARRHRSRSATACSAEVVELPF